MPSEKVLRPTQTKADRRHLRGHGGQTSSIRHIAESIPVYSCCDRQSHWTAAVTLTVMSKSLSGSALPPLNGKAVESAQPCCSSRRFPRVRLGRGVSAVPCEDLVADSGFFRLDLHFACRQRVRCLVSTFGLSEGLSPKSRLDGVDPRVTPVTPPGYSTHSLNEFRAQ